MINGLDKGTTIDNAGKKIYCWLEECVQEAAGLVNKDELKQQKALNESTNLKRKHGPYLLHEVKYHCGFPGCGQNLRFAKNGEVQDAYEISLIYKDKKANLDNLIALCPQCFATYLLDNRKAKTKELAIAKAIYSSTLNSETMLDDVALEKGITKVISKLSNLDDGSEEATFDPKELQQKVSPIEHKVLYQAIKNYSNAYFVAIKNILKDLDKSGDIDYEDLQGQVRSLYKKLKKAGKTQEEIFNEIANKFHKVTLQEHFYCEILVSYFVQSCEVYDAITE